MDPGSKAYHTAVRSGLCNAYLAASVIGSGFVSTSEMGVMGKVSDGVDFERVGGTLTTMRRPHGLRENSQSSDCVEGSLNPGRDTYLYFKRACL